MAENAVKTCFYPECEKKGILGLGGPVGNPAEHYCAEHVDYGVGRVFGPLHRLLDAATRKSDKGNLDE